jgi:hypothetical protein
LTVEQVDQRLDARNTLGALGALDEQDDFDFFF